jgi:hypothetical protein
MLERLFGVARLSLHGQRRLQLRSVAELLRQLRELAVVAG